MGVAYISRIKITFVEHDDEEDFVKALRKTLKELKTKYSVSFTVYWEDLEGSARPKIPYPEEI